MKEHSAERHLMNIKGFVKNNEVRFSHYHEGQLIYDVNYFPEDDSEKEFGKVFQFPVPIGDCGNATFMSKDNALYFMRYIRKAMEEGNLVPYGYLNPKH